MITCLPSPGIIAAVMEAEDGILTGSTQGKIWAEMSTTDKSEVHRPAHLTKQWGCATVDCPVLGGFHRAVTADISIFVGCESVIFDYILPYLKKMVARFYIRARWVSRLF